MVSWQGIVVMAFFSLQILDTDMKPVSFSACDLFSIIREVMGIITEKPLLMRDWNSLTTDYQGAFYGFGTKGQ